MSWPHTLSFSRFVAGPGIAALILWHAGDPYLVASAAFIVASLTDLLDGKAARYAQTVSPLGIFLDTTADKVLVSLTLIAMTVAGVTAAWIPLVIIGREFVISGLRSYAASQNCIISAHIWGKGKAAFTMVAIPMVLAAQAGRDGDVISGVFPHHVWGSLLTLSNGVLVLSALLTVISGLRYLVDARPLFQSKPTTAVVELEERRRVAAGQRRDG